MPMPKEGESQEKYMSRCMAYPDMQGLEQDARYAKCNGMWEQAHKNMSDNQSTFDLQDVEIFETGKHKGDDYTEKDLDDMVTCFNETKGRLKPYVKLGHNPGQVLLQQDGMPAAGWITNLKRQGTKLVANFSSVPKKIKDLIDRKAYGRFSSEIFWNGKIDNKDYRRGIRAVALLGGDTPAVQTLNDFINLYTDDNIELGTLKIYDDEADDMAADEKFGESLQVQLKEYSTKLEDATKKEVQFGITINNLEGQIKELKTKIDTDEKVKEAQAKEARVNEIKMFMEAQIKEGKILPAQVKVYTEMAERDFDSVKALVKDMPKLVDLKERSEKGEHKTEEKNYSEMNDQEKEDHIDIKCKEYIAEKKDVSYAEAYVVIKEKLEGK